MKCSGDANTLTTQRNGAFMCQCEAKTVFHSEVRKNKLIAHSKQQCQLFVYPVEFPNNILNQMN